MAFMVTVRDEREEAEIMKYVGVHDVNMGKGRVRKSFATIDEVVEMPDLIEVQKNSYERFLKEDLREVLNDVSPIYDFNGNLKLEFVDYALDKTPKYSLEECRERDMTYATALKVLVRLTNNETGEVKESEVFMGDFPLMTEHGTFIINGGERVIVSQLVRSPGVYYRESIDKAGKHLFDTQVIPSRGAWLEYEIDSNDVIWVRVDRARKLPVTSLLRALGYGSDEQIRQLLGNDEKLEATMQRDGGDDGTRRTRSGNEVKSKESGLMDIYRRLRPGEVGTVDSAEKLLHATFFDPKRYDMMRVGRYKYNKKLAIAARIRGHVVDQDIIDPATGEVLIAAGERIPAAKTDPLAKKIQDAGVNDIYLRLEDRVVRVIGNNFVDAAAWLSEEEIEKSGINEMVHLPTLKQLLETAEQEGMDELAKIRLLHQNLSALMPKHILIDDIVARVIRSEGGFVWACKNYDGDVMSDMVSTAFGSLAMMTSVLVSPDGNYEYEAAHGTVTRHYYKYLKGEATSTNPMATIFAWSGALKKRGELDSLPALVRFGEALEAASLQTLNDGIMTKDLCGLAEGITPTQVNSEEFIKAIRTRLEAKLA